MVSLILLDILSLTRSSSSLTHLFKGAMLALWPEPNLAPWRGSWRLDPLSPPLISWSSSMGYNVLNSKCQNPSPQWIWFHPWLIKHSPNKDLDLIFCSLQLLSSRRSSVCHAISLVYQSLLDRAHAYFQHCPLAPQPIKCPSSLHYSTVSFGFDVS